MKRWICLAAVLGLWPTAWAAAQETAEAEAKKLETTGFRVVVNAANKTAALGRSRISKMFLKKTRTWADSDLPVELVDQREKSPVRAAFTRAIHDGKKVSAIKSYWNRRIFSGRDVPPPELPSDQEVLDFVRRDPGGIGYVSPDADLGEGVKELTVTE